MAWGLQTGLLFFNGMQSTRFASSNGYSGLLWGHPILRLSVPGSWRFHIGGTIACEGWEILNAISEPWIEHVGQAEDLSRFQGNTFAELYASHVLEQPGCQSALFAALIEWHRVLAPEGHLMVIVPDLDTLCELYVQRDSLVTEDRFRIMRMMFGGRLISMIFIVLA
jgi:predicted SAM-dependent methyltransferase